MSFNALPHLPKEVIEGVEGTRLDSYLIALEAWRRGLTVQWLSRPNQKFNNYNRDKDNFVGIIYTVSSNTRSHNFYLSWGDGNTYEAYENTQNKVKAKELLGKAGINVPEGRAFYEETNDGEIVEFAEQLGYPLVLKPTNQGKGKGVITNINNDEELEKSLQVVREELGFKDVILEKYIDGEEYRLYVVNDQVISGVYRKPPNVVGNGISTISALIKQKNEIRLNNPHIRKLPNPFIKVDEIAINYLKKTGYNLYSVPAEGELVYLRRKGNFSEGSDSVDVTDILTPKLKNEAVKALKSIPGLSHAGIDLINTSSNDKHSESFVILEFNASAIMGSHVFPLAGKPRDIPAAIIDFYFPETTDCKRSTVYFDLNSILESLKSRTANMVELAPAPLEQLFAKLYIIKSNKNSRIRARSYQRQIRNKAHQLGLHGHIKNCIDNKVEILIAGSSENDVNNIKSFIQADTNLFDSIDIEIKDYIKLIKIGFHLKDELDPAKIGYKLMGLGHLYNKLERSKVGPFIKLLKTKM